MAKLKVFNKSIEVQKWRKAFKNLNEESYGDEISIDHGTIPNSQET
jgi:hypothetical protein